MCLFQCVMPVRESTVPQWTTKHLLTLHAEVITELPMFVQHKTKKRDRAFVFVSEKAQNITTMYWHKFIKVKMK